MLARNILVMHQPVNGGPFPLQIPQVLRICRYLDGDKLVVPDMIRKRPVCRTFAKRPAADLGVEEILGNSLVLRRRFFWF